MSPCWSAPLYAAGLSLLVLPFYVILPFFLGAHSYAYGIPLFLCWWPMAIFLGARVQNNSEKQICDLQRRIEQLETQGGQPAS